MEYEAGVDSNFVLVTARNDQELAAVSNSFVTAFTKSCKHPLSPEDLAGSHTDVYPLSLLLSFPGAWSLEEVRRNTRGTSKQATLQRADKPRSTGAHSSPGLNPKWTTSMSRRGSCESHTSWARRSRTTACRRWRSGSGPSRIRSRCFGHVKQAR
ncbi:hypothetical protein BC827DRAFT_196418 [Russula dissimulans]|nr:hypothetical protein BC827DRAFT_196418 [Russula dissimulans]